MAITVDCLTQTIHVPQADLTHVTGSLYSLDVDWFRLELKNWEDSETGMAMPSTHRHNTEVTVAGVTYARTVEIINGYSVEFEDGQYAVRLEGANNNIFDVEGGILVRNQVSVIPTNSAGLQIVTVGSGLSVQEQQWLQAIHRAHFNKRDLSGNLIRIYDTDGTTVLYEFTTDSLFSHVTPA